MAIRKKKAARKLNMRRRHQALTSNQKIIAFKFRKVALRLLVASRRNGISLNESKRLHSLAKVALRRYFAVILESLKKLSKQPNLHRTIDSFTEAQCWNWFETRKDDLSRLVEGLRFQDLCILENNIKEVSCTNFCLGSDKITETTVSTIQ